MRVETGDAVDEMAELTSESGRDEVLCLFL